MSTLSKIFVVLNLILSIVFATFVTHYYQHAQNWRQKHDELQVKSDGEIKDREGKIKDANAAVDSLKRELTLQRDQYYQLQAALERLQSENGDLATKLMKSEDLNRSLNASIDRLTAELTRANDEVRRLTEEREQSRLTKEAAIREMERAQEAAHEWQLQADEKDNLLRVMRDRVASLSEKIDQYTMVLQEMAHQGIPVERFVVDATPLIQGRVTGVFSGVVMISVGSDDGVREGFEFTVYRGEKYLCKIRIDKTFPDEAAGEIVPDSIRPDAGSAPVQVNDNVTTRL